MHRTLSECFTCNIVLDLFYRSNFLNQSQKELSNSGALNLAKEGMNIILKFLDANTPKKIEESAIAKDSSKP